ISQEASKEFGPDYLWRWSPWIQLYIAAGSFAVLGPTTLAARLPFTVLAFLTIPLTYRLARRLFDSIAAARLSALFLALSVPFLFFFNSFKEGGTFDLATFNTQFRIYGAAGLTFVLPLPAIVVLVYFLLRRRDIAGLGKGWRQNVLFLLIFSLSYMFYLSLGP